MTMEMTKPANPALTGVSAARDMGIRRGGGMESDLPVLSYANMVEAQKAGMGVNLRRYSVIMRMPTNKGVPADQIADHEELPPLVRMPANKANKWYGQGYRFVDGTDDGAGGYNTELVVHVQDATPRQWLPSMVSDAIYAGEPIPAEMAPPGYTGETFPLRDGPPKPAVETPVEVEAPKQEDMTPVGEDVEDDKGLIYRVEEDGTYTCVNDGKGGYKTLRGVRTYWNLHSKANPAVASRGD